MRVGTTRRRVEVLTILAGLRFLADLKQNRRKRKRQMRREENRRRRERRWRW